MENIETRYDLGKHGSFLLHIIDNNNDNVYYFINDNDYTDIETTYYNYELTEPFKYVTQEQLNNIPFNIVKLIIKNIAYELFYYNIKFINTSFNLIKINGKKCVKIKFLHNDKPYYIYMYFPIGYYNFKYKNLNSSFTKKTKK